MEGPDRWRIHDVRREPQSSNWKEVVNMLNNAMAHGDQDHGKRLVTVCLPDGVRAVFKGKAVDALLDILRRTDSQATVIQGQQLDRGSGLLSRTHPGTGATSVGFDALQLYGTAEENADAIRMLPDIVVAINTDGETLGRSLNASDLRLGVTDPSGARPNLFEQTFPFEKDELDEVELEELEDSLDDITYSTSTARVPGESPWSHSGLVARATQSGSPSRPKTWSTLAFATYVEDLTATRSQLVHMHASHGRRRQPSDTTARHYEGVTTQLKALLLEPSMLQYLTSTVVDNCLRFYIRRGDVSATRELFAHLMQQTTYKLTASNFNNLLASTASQGGIHDFRAHLAEMLRCDIKPTWQTWVRLYELAALRADASARNLVEKHMRLHGLIPANVQAVREVVASGIQQILEDGLLVDGSRASVEGFFEICDQRFGLQTPPVASISVASRSHVARKRSWLTTNAGNRMIEVYLRRTRIEDAFYVLDRLAASGESASTVTLNTFLASAMMGRDIQMAVAALKHRNLRTVQLSHVSYGLLFKLARERQCYNMLRVIWRYACLAGAVTRRMHDTVQQSLVSYPFTETSRFADAESSAVLNVPPHHLCLSHKALAEFWAGKFCIGVEDGLQTARESPFSEREHSIIGAVAQPRTQAASEYASKHETRRTTLLHLLSDDLNASQDRNLIPARTFANTLQLAWERDVEWKDQGMGLPTGLQQAGLEQDMSDERQTQILANEFKKMMSRGVKVPTLVAKRSARSAVKSGTDR